MNELINKYLELNDKKKEIENELEEVKKEIKLEMRADDLHTYETDTANVFYTEVKRNTLDKDKLKNFIEEDNLEKCYTETCFDKLEVKRKTE